MKILNYVKKIVDKTLKCCLWMLLLMLKITNRSTKTVPIFAYIIKFSQKEFYAKIPSIYLDLSVQV